MKVSIAIWSFAAFAYSFESGSVFIQSVVEAWETVGGLDVGAILREESGPQIEYVPPPQVPRNAINNGPIVASPENLVTPGIVFYTNFDNYSRILSLPGTHYVAISDNRLAGMNQDTLTALRDRIRFGLELPISYFDTLYGNGHLTVLNDIIRLLKSKFQATTSYPLQFCNV